LRSKFNDIVLQTTDDIDVGIEEIKSTVKGVVICSGGVAKSLVPKIQYFKNVIGVLIFCGNIAFHRSWS
jgi:hypothetical protein